MTPRFLFHPAARAELTEAVAWYEAQRPGLGEDLGQVVAAALARLSAHPALYPEVLAGVRRIVLARFPYSLFYRVRPESIEILAVFHHRRDPVTWHRRAAP
jgi:plasmid stabilization system protein ParE